MAKVFRILDRFKITGRGTVYMIKNDPDMSLHLEDILYDLKGHRFQIIGFEMFRHLISDIPFEELPVGILFRALDEVEAEGQIFVDSFNDICFLFCNHPLYQRRVDEDFQEEYQAAGLNHPCALFSYEDLEKGSLSLYGNSISGLTIYRGWMMKPDMYKTLYLLLEERGIILINTPEEYERYHLLPGWYHEFSNETVHSVWEDIGTLSAAMSLTKNLHGSYVVKDFVKSRKYEWYDACFIQNIENRENAERIIGNLRSIGFHEKSGMPISEEYRIFVFAGNLLCVNDYWENANKTSLSDDEVEWIKSIAKRIKSNFVTIDVARKEDGSLIIMELGDGQVSGLQQIDPTDFYGVFDKE